MSLEVFITKSTGICKNIDKLGRFKLPKELQNILNIKSNDSMVISLQGNSKIVCQKEEDKCIICNSNKNMYSFMGKKICKSCINKIKYYIN